MGIALDDIDLPYDLDWVDEFGGWSPVKRQHTEGSTGKLIVQSGVLSDGRPITLASTNNGGTGAWCKRLTVEQIRQKLSETAVMNLTFHSRSFNVVWDPDSPFTAEQIIRTSNPSDDVNYSITLKLVEVTE